MPIREAFYDPGATYAARRHVVINGTPYEAGTPVPRAVAPDERTYRKWFENRLLSRFPADSPKASASQGGVSAAVTTLNNTAEPIALANGHAPAAPQSASEALLDATAAAAAQAAQQAAAPVLTEDQKATGYLHPGGRGWFTVYFRDEEPRKVRTLSLASQTLDEMRVAAGLAPLTPPAPEASAEVQPAQLQPGDEVVNGETGEITTFTAAGAYSAPAEMQHTTVAVAGDGGPWGEGDGPDEESPRDPSRAL